MWPLLLLCFTYVQPVLSQEENQMILQSNRGPCEGYIQIYHESQWGLVGNKNWVNETEEVVCRNIDCGKRIKSEEIYQPPNSFIGLNQVNCSGNEADLWECAHLGWNVSRAPNLFVRHITCSNQINIRLDRFQCSGYVQYSTDGTAPSHYFCGDEWGNNEKSVACNTLQCGKPVEDDLYEQMNEVQSRDLKVAKCVGNVAHLWQCVKEQKQSCGKPAFVTCEDHDILRLKGNSSNVCSGQLEIKKNDEWTHDMSNSKSKNPGEWCKKLFCGDTGRPDLNGSITSLTCSDQVKVVLRDDKNKNNTCYGSVRIEVNSTFHSVCASEASWPQKNGEVVCKELNCGELIDISRKPVSLGIMDSVRCTGDEASLWHCKAKRHHESFKCSREPFVICSGSVDVRLKDGPGRCAGRVEIFFEGEWKRVMQKKDSLWLEDNAKTVCKQLGCGGVQSRTEKFSRAEERNPMTRTVTCTRERDNIVDCNLKESYGGSGNDEEVGLVCEGHKVFYLDSNRCSGLVKVLHGNINYYLSGSNDTWNSRTASEVCKQMHCGNLTDFSTADVNTTSSIWHPDPSCSFKTNPLLDCGKSAPSNGTNTVAWVECSGNKTMTLTNGCWGNVDICAEGDCGGVCKESWTKDKSKKLCQELGCGSHALNPTKPVENFPVKFKSVHMAEQGGNLSTCSFVKQTSTCKSAYVVCSASLKPQFKSSDYCSGKVEVKYENQWRPVCQYALQNTSIQTLFCEKLGCGAAVHSVDYQRPISNAISTMTCDNPTQHKNLTECTASVEGTSCTHHGLKCSKWRKMRLVKGGACSGAVVVYSEGGMPASVSSQGWSEVEGKKLCEDLKCGKHLDSRPEKPVMGSEFWNATFNCTGVKRVENIWDCERKVSPTVEKQVYIECAGEPEFKLENRCHGKVRINNIAVCNTSWNDNYSDKVCQYRDYSNALPGNLDNPMPEKGKNYFHIHCDESDHEISQCSRDMGPCSGGLVSIFCTKNVKFEPIEKCGGQIEVIYETENGGKVCYDKELSEKHKKDICRELKCGKPIPKPKEVKTQVTPEEIKSWDTLLSCTGNEEHPRYCLSRQSCAGKKPAEIYCDGFKPPEPPPPPPPKVNVLAIILGVGLFLILMIVIFIFVRIYIIRKNKNVKNFLPGLAQRNDIEFDSGEFEEINSKEMDDMRSGEIRSESEVVIENDARSTSSIPYDDIDEVSEVQPLTSRPPTTDDPHDSGIQDNKLEQNAKEDGVTYEVDDPQENYDDIEADLELTQTTAEVHDSPRNAPECSTNAPPDLVLGDDDYLVPGQDE